MATVRRSVHDGSGIAWLAATLAVAAIASVWLRPPAAAAPSPTGADASSELEALRARVAQLERRIENLPTPAATGGSDGLRTEVVDWSRIERMIDERLVRAETGSLHEAESAVDPARLAGWLARLETPGADAAAHEVWARIREAGALDHAVAHFEELARAQAGSPDAQTALGLAYIEQMLASDDPSKRMELGKKVEAQFTRALEIAPDHWEARFRLAVGQSYADPLSGRRSDAITNFERLVQQQARGPAVAGREQTYIYLGRLYSEQGNADKAAAMWRLGLARHPGATELQRLVDGLGAGR